METLIVIIIISLLLCPPQDEGLSLRSSMITQLPGFSTRKVGSYLSREVSRQGGTISPMVLTACLEEVFNPLDWERLEVRINDEYLNNLRITDDIVLFSNTSDELQQRIEDLNRETTRVRLKINMQKTKIMFNSLVREQEFSTASQSLDSVREYAYLSQLLTGDPDHEK